MVTVTFENARDEAFNVMNFAQCEISGKRVGAAVVARNKHGTLKIFSGCNIEWGSSIGVHAEVVALIKAISEGYCEVLELYVTSNSVAHRAAGCEFCRGYFMTVNPECAIYVFNPDRSLKIAVNLIDAINYPYIPSIKIHFP